MTRKEILCEYEATVASHAAAAAAGIKGAAKSYELFKAGLAALRGPTREQVERMRGEWTIGEPDVLGVPIHCNKCGWGSDHADLHKWMEYNGHLFCGHCGAPMTDEAVDMMLRRWKEAVDGEMSNL